MTITRWPEMLHGSPLPYNSRPTWPAWGRGMKGAEVSKDATTKLEVVMCPHCDEIQEFDKLGVMQCQNCEQDFDVYLPDLEGE